MSSKEIFDELKQIREAINRIEIKGAENANYVLFACQKCDGLMNTLGQAISEETEVIEVGE